MINQIYLFSAERIIHRTYRLSHEISIEFVSDQSPCDVMVCAKFPWIRLIVINSRWPWRSHVIFQKSYRQISNISSTKSQNLNVYRLVLQMPLPNPLKPGVKTRMKMQLEQRRQAMLQLHLSDQQFYYIVMCVYIRGFMVVVQCHDCCCSGSLCS